MGVAVSYRKPEVWFPIPAVVAERAATRYVVDDAGCYVSTYSVGSHGYAQIGWSVNCPMPDGRIKRNTMTTAPRAAWVHHTGGYGRCGRPSCPHRCRQCVRIDHLRLLTNLDNATDNNRANAVDPELTGPFCREGHPLWLYVSGAVHCRPCATERTYRKRARTAAA